MKPRKVMPLPLASQHLKRCKRFQAATGIAFKQWKRENILKNKPVI
jgi:hypothetical protein